MKKLSILCVSVMIALASYAQAGSFGVELGFNPFNAFGENFSVDGLKVRGFVSEKVAIRGIIDFSMNPQTNYSYYTNNDNKEIETQTKTNVTTFGFTPGVEFHVATGRRHSVYVGAEVGFGMTKASYTRSNDFDKEKTEITGANGINNPSVIAGTTYGAAIFTGVDYYITKNLFIGAELGFGYDSFTSQKEITTKYTNSTGTSTETTAKGHRTNTSLGFAATPTFRLGWTF